MPEIGNQSQSLSQFESLDFGSAQKFAKSKLLKTPFSENNDSEFGNVGGRITSDLPTIPEAL